jgi:Flp pilus assembly protein TadG
MRVRLHPATDFSDVCCRAVLPPRARRSGAAAVEFAIVLPVLVTILLGTTDFGRFSHSTIAVANAARCGAQYASMNPYDSSTQAAWTAGVVQAVTNELNQSPTFDASKLTVTVTNVTESGGLHRTSVQVTYPFKTVINWPSLPSSFNMQQTVVVRGIR